MNLRSFAPRVTLVASFLALVPLGHAATTTYTGNFTADNNVFSDSFTTTSLQNFTFTTNSAAMGGFLPVLTLFNSVSGLAIAGPPSNTGFGDISIAATLTAGSYVLDLTEFPSELADGTHLSSGFSPFAAGDTGANCSLGNVNFINDVTCSATPLGSNYSVTVASSVAASPTPEPSSLVLLLAPAAGLVEVARRRRRNA